MDNKNNIFERIEAYLEDELSQEEKQVFEQEIANDAGLAEEVKLQEDTRKLLHLHNQVAYKEKLQAIDQQIEAEGGQAGARILQPVWQRPWFRAVAAVVLILIAAYFFALGYQHAGQLADEAFVPYRDLITYKGSTPNQDSLMQQAMYNYNLKKYPSAITLFNQVLVVNPDSPDAQFYLANALLADHQPKLAISILENVSTTVKYKEAGPWYLALAYLGDEQVDQARKSLEQIIATPGHAYADRAKALLEKME